MDKGGPRPTYCNVMELGPRAAGVLVPSHCLQLLQKVIEDVGKRSSLFECDGFFVAWRGLPLCTTGVPAKGHCVGCHYAQARTRIRVDREQMDRQWHVSLALTKGSGTGAVPTHQVVPVNYHRFLSASTAIQSTSLQGLPFGYLYHQRVCTRTVLESRLGKQ